MDSLSSFCTLPFEYADTPDRRAVSLEPEGFPCIPVLQYSHFTSAKPHVEKHRHPGCIEFVYCLRGSLTFELGQKPVPLLPGQVLAIPPNARHRLLTNRSGLVTYGLFFRFDLPRPILRLPRAESAELRHALEQLPRAPFTANASIGHLFRELFDTLDFSPHGTYRRLLLRARILELLVTFLDSAAHPADSPTSHQRVTALIAEIRRHPENDYTADGLAHGAALSGSLVNALFKEMTGLPPHAFILSCRLAAALKALRESERTVTEIAASLHFSSSQHLASLFRRCYGISPIQARSGIPPVIQD